MLALSLVAFAVIGLRAAYLQTIDGRRLSAIATQDQERTVPLPAPRGGLFDRLGRAFAISDQATTLAAYTGLVHDPAALADRLAPLVGVSADRLVRRLTAPGVKYVYLANGLDAAQVARIKRAHLPDAAALDYPQVEQRAYPQGIVGAQLIGLASDTTAHSSGLERSLDGLVRGHAGQDVDVLDTAQQVLRRVSHVPARPGHDVRLTLDRDIQAYTEQAVAQARLSEHADAVTAVVLDPRTGGVLAMASAPGIRPGGYARSTPDQWRIRAITDQYEPGSTFKAVTFGAALSAGVITPSTQFVVPYSISKYGKTVTDAETHATETLTARQILEVSSNVGTITIAETRLGESRLQQWITKLGFGRRTGIDLPGEEPGTVPASWSGTSILNIPIGEGVAVTPLQMAALYGAIANHGMWIEPHVVAHVAGGSTPAPQHRRLFTPGVAAQLVSMLHGVVDVGTGTQAQICGYTVAGKTGTTPKINPHTNKYDGATYGYHSSFVGFVPARNPRVLVLVMVDTPRTATSYYGAWSAAPVFRVIAQNALQVLGVPPDQPAQQSSCQAPTAPATTLG